MSLEPSYPDRAVADDVVPALAEWSGGLETPAETADERPLEGLQATPSWVAWLRVLILVATDTVVLAGTWTLAYFLWASPVRQQPLEPYVRLLPLLALFILGYAKAGLYPGFGLGAVETFRRLSLRTSFVYLVLAAGSFALKLPHQYSRMSFAIAWVASLLVLPLARCGVHSLMRGVGWWAERAVVIGLHGRARRAISGLRAARSVGYEPCCLLEIEPSELEEFEGLPILGGLELVDGLASRGVRVAVLAVDEEEGWAGLLRYLQTRFRHLILVRAGSDVPVEGVTVRNLGGVLGIEFRNQLLVRRNRVLKRGLDLTLGMAGLVISLPIVALAGVAVRMVSRGPSFFRQEREGLSGEEISVVKLRTMYLDADERLEACLRDDPSARKEWQEGCKLSRDPRIIPLLGTFLRRWSLDELPQFWSVVKGDMSLVGPRPFPNYHLKKFSPDFRAFRRLVRPGLTGLWQVTTRSEGGVDEQETLDSYYIRNWSIWLDLYILGRTLGAVVIGRGAY